MGGYHRYLGVVQHLFQTRDRGIVLNIYVLFHKPIANGVWTALGLPVSQATSVFLLFPFLLSPLVIIIIIIVVIIIISSSIIITTIVINPLQ